MPYKLFGEFLDLQTEYATQLTHEAETKLIDFQESIRFPWTLSAEQAEEWNQRCRHLEQYVTA